MKKENIIANILNQTKDKIRQKSFSQKEYEWLLNDAWDNYKIIQIIEKNNIQTTKDMMDYIDNTIIQNYIISSSLQERNPV
jgi:thiamine monophosphate kinase